MTPQLPLTLPAPPHFRLEQFDIRGNEQALALLTRHIGSAGAEPPLLLFGASGVGKTHLLVASAIKAREQGRHAGYLALSRWSDFTTDALDALAAHDYLAIDEVERIAGRRDAEIALFDLYNRCRDGGRQLLLAAREPLARLPLALPDLASRLSAASAVALNPLSETARRGLLRDRARARGFELEPAVIEFLFRRYPRDLPGLMALVERLDRESLAQQRRVTVPLVRSVIAEDSDPEPKD